MMATEGEFKQRSMVETSLDVMNHNQSFLSYSNNIANINETSNSQVSSGKATSLDNRKGVLISSQVANGP